MQVYFDIKFRYSATQNPLRNVNTNENVIYECNMVDFNIILNEKSY